MSVLHFNNDSVPKEDISRNSGYKIVGYWLLTGCAIICLMVILGGITRITQSGLSMTDWNITGSLPPMSESDWAEEFNRYQQFPEYKLINGNFTVEEFKNIYWWEFIHRLTGRLSGIIFLIPFFWFLIKRKLPPRFTRKGLVLLALGGSQGVLGWMMVRSGLNHAPHVSHYLLASHFALALTTLAFTFWFALQILSPGQEKPCISKLKKWSVSILVVVSVQMVYGALLAGLKGGHLYPTFPMMGDHWIAPEIFRGSAVWLNFISEGAGVQFVHRILGSTALLITILFYFKTKRFPTSRALGITLRLNLTIVVVQFTLGVLTLLYNVPQTLAFFHQLAAVVLFLSCVFIAYRIHHHNPVAMT